jgi:hypothetical protein
VALLAGALGLLVWSAALKTVPRFTSAPLNYAAVIVLVWAIPISVLGLALTSGQPYTRMALFFGGLLLGLAAFPVTLW